MVDHLRLGAGIGDLCSGGWTSNKSLQRKQRLEKLQALANPQLQVSVDEIQARALRLAEGNIESDFKVLSEK